jgi:hypothetical protein
VKTKRQKSKNNAKYETCWMNLFVCKCKVEEICVGNLDEQKGYYNKLVELVEYAN